MSTQHFAELGAAVRLTELEQERAGILKLFPRLEDPAARRRVTSVSGGLAPKRKVSKAARAAMSEGMRKFWARRKAGKKD